MILSYISSHSYDNSNAHSNSTCSECIITETIGPFTRSDEHQHDSCKTGNKNNVDDNHGTGSFSGDDDGGDADDDNGDDGVDGAHHCKHNNSN